MLTMCLLTDLFLLQLFCAFTSTFTLTMLTSAYKGYFGDLDYPGLVGFGVFIHVRLIICVQNEL